jgi:hypothetical protein
MSGIDVNTLSSGQHEFRPHVLIAGFDRKREADPKGGALSGRASDSNRTPQQAGKFL